MFLVYYSSGRRAEG